MFDDGEGGLQTQTPSEALRASIAREMRYLLTIASDAGQPSRIREAGIAHSMSVCLIEDSNMSRGKGKAGQGNVGNAMPRFVDVRLTGEQRDEFKLWFPQEGGIIQGMQALADEGYRVGVSWSGEQQAYTVSLTCRDKDSVNNGLCMTSFARTLDTALRLALYKHRVVAQGSWVEGGYGSEEEFG